MISSVVVTFEADQFQNGVPNDHSLAQLESRPDLELGPIVDRRIPIVICGTSHSEVEQTTCWIQQLPGVVQVDVAFVYLDQKNPEIIES